MLRSSALFAATAAGLVGVCAVASESPFASDDECLADGAGDNPGCALSLLKRRAEAQRGLDVEQREVQEQASNSTGLPTRLRVTNGCGTEPMWIAHMVGAGVGHDPQNVKLAPHAYHDFQISNGMASTRYWPKLGCDAQGEECRIGQSGGPGQSCPKRGCGPPIDSKFEATFGVVGAVCDTAHGQISGCDWLDISLVDGFTVPFKVEVLGDCGGLPEVDCSGLKLSHCPQDLVLKEAGSDASSGCYSPCAKKTYPQWGNEAGRHKPWDVQARMECCPTPPVSPAQCSSGPVASSEYVKMVHEHCPGVYGYAYDDAQGLSVCKAGVQYHVTFFCPN